MTAFCLTEADASAFLFNDVNDWNLFMDAYGEAHGVNVFMMRPFSAGVGQFQCGPRNSTPAVTDAEDKARADDGDPDEVRRPSLGVRSQVLFDHLSDDDDDTEKIVNNQPEFLSSAQRTGPSTPPGS